MNEEMAEYGLKQKLVLVSDMELKIYRRRSFR